MKSVAKQQLESSDTEAEYKLQCYGKVFSRQSATTE
jgi:hypothetical protein